MNQTSANTEALPHNPRLKHLTLKYFFAFFSGISLFLFSINLPIYLHYVQGITVSVGLALLTTEDQHLDKLMQKADLALYQAKEQGRNRVVLYQDTGAESAA